MKLSEMIKDIDIVGRVNFEDVEVTGITNDSGQVEAGNIFVAVRGVRADGHDYIDHAASRGASAVVVEKEVESNLPQVVVHSSAEVLGLMARRYYRNPDEGVMLIGITGTNGKTSTSFLIRSILEESMGKTGIIGTVGFGWGKNLNENIFTTPGALKLYRILADFNEQGVRNVVMEVSSHAIDQYRVAGLKFDIVVYTNITRDHLDYHGTFKEYVKTKGRLKDLLFHHPDSGQQGVMIYNRDDSEVKRLADEFEGRKVSFGLGGGSDVYAEKVNADLEGTKFDICVGEGRVHVDMKLLGEFNVYNALAAASAATYLGIKPSRIKSGIEGVESVPGRFQVIQGIAAPKVIVDYAHTPDAMKNLLSFCRKLKAKRIITVFGCGGDRDKGKRPMMGEIAAEYSDVVIITSDNPRTEDPASILGDIVRGIEPLGTPYQVIEDRREAIRAGVREGNFEELVVIAGKGHEAVQILKDTREPFSDVEEAKLALKMRRTSSKSS
jgi:UDP-N-acetylmuramoyl-L-alanyl-D-glutamate--2,6-diaminopimelate ligase